MTDRERDVSRINEALASMTDKELNYAAEAIVNIRLGIKIGERAAEEENSKNKKPA